MTMIDRRQAFGILAATTASACATSSPETSLTPVSSNLFQHGVASGDPTSDGIVLWTRVTTTKPSLVVKWQLANDSAFARIIKEGVVETTDATDFTVKAIPGQLQAGTTYFYRFLTDGAMSPTGRTKTLATGKLAKLGIALVSCSNYAFGHFNAYAAIAEDADVDIVLHTGDYIYEYGAAGWGSETAKVLGRVHDPAHEIVTLADYRRRHAQYKTDAGSRAMHGAHPFVACWDDHESTNNPWMGGAQNHQPATEGDWATRRAASLQAYYEWMPIREPELGKTRADFWRTYAFGDLATLITLETRHTGRGEQVDFAKYVDKITSKTERDAFMANVIGDPARKMISPAMERDLGKSLEKSVSDRQPWRIIGNASPIARMLVPDVLASGIDVTQAPKGKKPGEGANLLWKAKWNLPFYTDTWDGYPVAREAFYDLCKSSRVQDLLVLTGDSHSFWSNTLADDSGRAMGAEIGTAGVSSPGDFVETGWSKTDSEKLDRYFETALPEVVWTDNFNQGYVRVVLTPSKADVSFMATNSVLIADKTAHSIRTETVVRKGDTIGFA
jgi:alkaline phosphatase D